MAFRTSKAQDGVVAVGHIYIFNSTIYDRVSDKIKMKKANTENMLFSQMSAYLK